MAIDPQWIQAGSNVLASVLKPPSSSPAISGAPVYVNQDFDFSGFTVGTGSSKVTGAPNNKTSAPEQGVAGTGASSNMLPALIVGGAALAGFIWG